MSRLGSLSRYLCVLAVVLLLPLLGCGADEPAGGDSAAEESAAEEAGGDLAESTEESDEEDKPARRETTTSVNTALVERRDLVLPVKAEGRIRARHTSDIRFERAGRIDRIHVEEGQRVRRGHVLVRLDDRELELALEEATSRYLRGLGQLAVEEDRDPGSKDAERTLDKQRAELEERERAGEITREERLDLELQLGMEAVRDGAYRRELIEVRSGLAAARADAAKLRIELERTEIRAPFSGVISGMVLNVGETVRIGQVFSRLVDDVNVEAAVGVLESDLAVVSVGKAVLLEVPALGETFPLQVDVVDPEVSPDSRTCQVLLRLRSDEHRVKPGMFVRAWIAGEVLPDRLLVPREAIVSRDGRPVLFRVEEDRAKWVYVQLGPQNDRLVEITRVDQGGPLDPGTPVIVSNHLTMTHDAKIKVRETIEVPDLWSAAVEGSAGD